MTLDAAARVLFLHAHPDDETLATGALIADLVAECEREGVLLIVEFLLYRLEGETDEEYAAAFADLLVGATELGVACGSKVLMPSAG